MVLNGFVNDSGSGGGVTRGWTFKCWSTGIPCPYPIRIYFDGGPSAMPILSVTVWLESSTSVSGVHDQSL